MTFDAMRLDVAASDRNLRWTFGTSLVLHALLLLALAGQHARHELDPGLAEIVLLDASEFGGGELGTPAPAAPAAPADRTQKGMLAERHDEVRFRRATSEGGVAPDPQSNTAYIDQLESRLATLQSATRIPVTGLASIAGAPPVAARPSGVPGASGSGGAGLALRRGPGLGTGMGSGPGLALHRGENAPASELALASLPAEKPRSKAPRMVAASRSTPAGVSLAGPIADRAVLSLQTPEYPEWAKREAFEASVTLYFVVLPDGRVKEDVQVQKTAGFQDFDDSACTALRAWRFEPLAEGRTGEQWGTITYRFRLRDAR